MGDVLPIPASLPMFRRPPGLPRTCSDEDLLEAVKASLCGAQPEELADLLRVPKSAVRYWVSSKEWNALKQYVWPDLKGVLHTELVSVRSNILKQIAERVREGDPQFNMRGELVGYRPIKARDLTEMLVRTSEIIHVIEKEIGGIRDDEGNISLKELAEGLKRYAQAKDVTVEAARP
jgi:hypothetical protein